MDTTFYHEDMRYRAKDDMRILKRPMTLDLDSPQKSSRKPRANSLLTSPDLNMLKLGSPELEKLIIAQHQNLNPNPCMYPKPEERDQQQYTRDFTDALTSYVTSTTNSSNLNVALYQQPGGDSMDLVSASSNCNTILNPCSTDSYGYQQSMTMNCNPMVSSTMNYNTHNGYYPEPLVHIKEEPQTVPCLGSSPPQSPIDMEDQEKMKLERKRLRNRIAASKCRRRKLEKIARLEDKVAHLKNENAELVSRVSGLRECICQLKQEMMNHVRSGCELLVSTYPTDV